MSSIPIELLSSEVLEELIRKIARELATRPVDDPVAYLEAWRQRVPGRQVVYEIEEIDGEAQGGITVADEYKNYYELDDHDPSKEELKRYLADQAIEQFVRYAQ